jgi:hypothetical protein
MHVHELAGFEVLGVVNSPSFDVAGVALVQHHGRAVGDRPPPVWTKN